MADAERVLVTLLHDLRSPLAVVDGFAALLERDDGSLTAEQRTSYARQIRLASDEMRRLLDEAAGIAR